MLLPLAKRVHFSHATQLRSNFGVFLCLFARKSIVLALFALNIASLPKHIDEIRILLADQCRDIYLL